MHRSFVVASLLIALAGCRSGSKKSSHGGGGGAPAVATLTVKSARFSMTSTYSGTVPDPGEGSATATCDVSGTAKADCALDAAAPIAMGALSGIPGTKDHAGHPVFGQLTFMMQGTSTGAASTDCRGKATPCGPTATSLLNQLTTIQLWAASADGPVHLSAHAFLGVPTDKAHACFAFDAAQTRVDLDGEVSSSLTSLGAQASPQTWELSGKRPLSKVSVNPAGKVTGEEEWKLTLQVQPGK